LTGWLACIRFESGMSSIVGTRAILPRVVIAREKT